MADSDRARERREHLVPVGRFDKVVDHFSTRVIVTPFATKRRERRCKFPMALLTVHNRICHLGRRTESGMKKVDLAAAMLEIRPNRAPNTVRRVTCRLSQSLGQDKVELRRRESLSRDGQIVEPGRRFVDPESFNPFERPAEEVRRLWKAFLSVGDQCGGACMPVPLAQVGAAC